MSHRTRRQVLLIIAALVVITAGCSDPREAVFNAETGGHETADWLPVGHALATRSGSTAPDAPSNPDTCRECHGADLSGGISGVSCAGCHLGGPDRVHPASWTNRYTSHGPFVAAGDAAACSNQACHGPQLEGVQNSGPPCSVCHDWPMAPGAPVVLKCGFCHSAPPDGEASPNRAGSHAKHLALANVTCQACHNGVSGAAGDPRHMNGTADIIFDAAYHSKSGAALYDAAAQTCSNVSCHGGPRTQTPEQAIQTAPTSTFLGSAPQNTKTQTPSWYGGTIDVYGTRLTAAQCTACHIYSLDPATEYNSYNSGRHFRHLWDPTYAAHVLGLTCVDCHDFLKLRASHFTTLNTTTMEGPTAAAIGPNVQYVGGTCSGGCHVPRIWFPPTL